MSKDYYQILGISRDATDSEIKKAFRQQALKCHPDRGKEGDEKRFKEINEAYQVLSDPKKRTAYDQFGSSEDFAGAAGGDPWGGAYGPQGVKVDFSGFGDYDGNIGDIFESFFGGRGATRNKDRRGNDIELQFKVTLKDAFSGKEIDIHYKRQESCPRCKGKGGEPDSQIENCKTCQGTGKEKITQHTFLGQFTQVKTCSRCQGKGKIPKNPCVKCGGAGVAKIAKNLEIKIPAGVDTGSTLEIPGAGDFNLSGKNPGNLYVIVIVESDPRFRRDKEELFFKKEITLSQAVLGDTIEIPTMDRAIGLKIPAGTQSHQKFRIRGKGFPTLSGRTRGDLFVEITVKIPEKLSNQERAVFEELAKLEKDQKSSVFENFKKGFGL